MGDVSKKGWLVILAGTLIWSITMVKSGLIYAFGMGFWGPNGHDGVWHIALTKGIARSSWEMPIFAGEAIKNYHVGFDLILAGLHKLTFIPIHTLYFQVLPPLTALLIGYFAYRFVYSWFRSHTKAFWAVFFVYFGGGWGWLVTLIREGRLGGESMFWSQQSISTLINPPFALSLVFLFAGLYYLRRGLRYKTKSKTRLIIATFLFGTLVQIKVYAGVLALGGLLVAGIWRMVQRKGISLMKVFTGALILSILIFSPTTKGIEQAVVFAPFWFLETMMSDPARFYWPKFAEAMVNYKLAGNWIKGIAAYGTAFLIFWFGNLGSRIIKEPLVFGWLKNWRKLTYLEVFFGSVIAAGGLIPLFFIQTGTPWNTIQFMYYALVFSGILAGIALGGWLERIKTDPTASTMVNHTKTVGLITVVVFLTIPTTIGTLRHYLPSRPPAKIYHEELEALEFLSSQPEGVVLTQPFDKDAAQEALDNPPRPLYLYESTAYVSAFSDKPVYLEDEVNLEITGYDWRSRREKMLELDEVEIGKAKKFINDNNIKYAYLLKDKEFNFEAISSVADKIFENQLVTIYRLD